MIFWTRATARLHELVVDRRLHKRAAGACANLALVQREHREPFERLVEEVVIVVRDIGEEDVRRLAAKFERHRDEVVGGILHDEPPGCRLARESDLRDPLALRERLSGLDAESVDHVQDARRKEIAYHFGEDQDAERRLLRGLKHNAIACGNGWRKLPCRHEERKVPRDDLSDDAKRLMVVIGNRVVVDLGNAAFLRAHDAGEIAPMVHDERQVGMGGFPDRLAVIQRLDEGEQIEVRLDPVRDPVHDQGAFLNGGLAPGVFRLMRGVEREFDIRRRGARNLAELLARDGAWISKYRPSTGATHLPPMKLSYRSLIRTLLEICSMAC